MLATATEVDEPLSQRRHMRDCRLLPVTTICGGGFSGPCGPCQVQRVVYHQ